MQLDQNVFLWTPTVILETRSRGKTTHTWVAWGLCEWEPLVSCHGDRRRLGSTVNTSSWHGKQCNRGGVQHHATLWTKGQNHSYCHIQRRKKFLFRISWKFQFRKTPHKEWQHTHTYTGLTFVTVALICFTSKEQTHVIGGNDSVNISLLSDGQEVCTLIFIKRQLLNTADLYWNLKPSEYMSIHL